MMHSQDLNTPSEIVQNQDGSFTSRRINLDHVNQIPGSHVHGNGNSLLDYLGQARPEPQGMTERDFKYWLQGFYEILGDAPALDPARVKMIRDHIGYVQAKSPFMHWLEGVLACFDGEIPQDVSKKIQAKLQDEFKHMGGSLPMYPQQQQPSTGSPLPSLPLITVC